MDTYRSEDEQLEVLKKWWQENGVSTVVTVVLALGAVVGYRGWQSSQQASLDNASFAYQEFLQAIVAVETAPDDIRIATAGHLAEGLKTDHAGTAYSHFAALFKAKQAVADGDYALAESELRWVLDNQPTAELTDIANLRLARVLFAQGQADAALALLDAGSGQAFAPAFLEVKGDIHLSSADYAAAVEAFNSSRDQSVLQGQQPSPTLAAKLVYAKSFQ